MHSLLLPSATATKFCAGQLQNDVFSNPLICDRSTSLIAGDELTSFVGPALLLFCASQLCFLHPPSSVLAICAHNLGFNIESIHCLLRHYAAKKDALGKESVISHARSVRTLPMRLVTVRKGLDAGVQSVVDDYLGKIKRYCTFVEMQIRPNPKNTSDVIAQVEAEGERVLRTITSNDWVVLVDERGKDLTSEQLATLIANAGDTGAAAIVFCIGGPYGHGSQVSKRANISVKLSSMVLNHQVAMIVLLEQIYRAWTILREKSTTISTRFKGITPMSGVVKMIY